MQIDKGQQEKELKETYPFQTEIYSRMGWIGEADKAIEMLQLKPLSIYMELFATEEPSLEQVAKQSQHYAVVRECLDDYCPEVVLRDCLLEAFKTFKKVMESQTERILRTNKLPEQWTKEKQDTSKISSKNTTEHLT